MYMSQELTYEIDEPAGSPYSRPMSPAILQQRILDLEKEARAAERRAGIAEMQNQILRERLVGFEQMVKTISHYADKLEKAVASVKIPPPLRDFRHKPAA